MTSPHVSTLSSSAKLGNALSHLDAWLDSMRSDLGYGGPMAHWWESNFLATGAQYDWRYEGIIDGYRELYLRTKQRRFLDKAKRAADDVVTNLLPNGQLRRSSFQFGPIRGGTPHEAAVCVGLLRLAQTLQSVSDDSCTRYVEVAARNLEDYWIGSLWNGTGFQDQSYNPVLVANKHGTLLEALLAFEPFSERPLDEYMDACIEVVLASQVHTGPQRGGIVHNGIGASRLAIPIYTARALNGLMVALALRPLAQTRVEAAQVAVREGLSFFSRMLSSDGVYWGVYGSGQLCANPRIIAGAGDILRCFVLADGLGLVQERSTLKRLLELLISAQQPAGGLPTGLGFDRKGLTAPSQTLEFRDVLPVVGWVDKTFRAFALLLEQGYTLQPTQATSFTAKVSWRGQRADYQETSDAIELSRNGRPLYLWRKGTLSPEISCL